MHFIILQAEKVVEQLVTYVSSHDVVGLKDYWSFLDKRLFRRLEHQYMGAVRKLEVNHTVIILIVITIITLL